MERDRCSEHADVYTKEDLDEIVSHGCQVPDCPHGTQHRLTLAPRCHKSAGCDVSYVEGAGILTMSCRNCGAVVAEVAVASEGNAVDDPEEDDVEGGLLQ